MSLEMHTYVPALDAALVAAWLRRLNELGMKCEVHPGIAWDSHSGFLPFKLQVQDSAHIKLNGVDFLTGFEYYSEPFSLESELESTRQADEMSASYSSPEVDRRLSSCRRRLVFCWGSSDMFELRMAMVSSAVVAEVGDGVACYPADGIWYDAGWTAERALGEARDYENSLKGRGLKYHKFERWL
jgi:hypothetical protein